MPTILVKKLHPEAKVPRSWSDIAVGYDLHALILSDTGRPNNVIIPPQSTRSIHTGIAIECPAGLFAEVRSRSGLGRRSIFVTNSPGTIDPDYRGEIEVLLYNGGRDTYYVQHGDRVAQLLFPPVYIADFEFREVERLSETTRGVSGFGSTGS